MERLYKKGQIKCLDLYPQGYTNMLIPSRGVFPIINIAEYYVQTHKEQFPYIPQHILPFTSIDIPGLSQHDMRSYWVKVYQGMSEKNPQLIVYENVLRGLGLEDTVAVESVMTKDGVFDLTRKFALEDYIGDVRTGKTIFIDTVISGRASTTILESLKNYHALLIVDNDAKSLQEPYKSTLKKLEQQGHITVIPVKRLYTEDRGPLFLESNANIYPKLIDALNSDKDLHKLGLLSAGKWEHIAYKSISQKIMLNKPFNELWTPYHKISRSLSMIHFAKVRALEGLKMIEVSDENIQLVAQSLGDTVDKTGFLDQEITKFYFNADDVTGSHILLQHVPIKKIKRIIENIKIDLRKNNML